MECMTSHDFETVSFPSFPSQGDKMLWRPSTLTKQIMRVADFIGFEMSFVPEVETVFLHRSEESARDMRVLVVVNNRDPKVRTEIYKREQAIMDELPLAEFDFHILARENRPLGEIVTDAGEIALKR
jgi:hypothetical protein